MTLFSSRMSSTHWPKFDQTENETKGNFSAKLSAASADWLNVPRVSKLVAIVLFRER